MIVIALYASDYPLAMDQLPNWADLPIGFFTCQRKLLRALPKSRPSKLLGTFTLAESPEATRPRTGEHLLAVFSYNNRRYIFQSTISHAEKNITRRRVWPSSLGLGLQLRAW